MKITIILILTLTFAVSNVFSQRTGGEQRQVSEPRIFFKKNNQEITERSGTKATRKMFDPNDKAKFIDLTVENIGNTQGLVVISESLDEKYNNWKVVIQNKGVTKSINSLYAIVVTRHVSPKIPGPLSTTMSEVVYSDQKILPKLDPGEQMTTWFSLDKSPLPKKNGSGAWSNLMPNLGPTNVWYTMNTYFVTEPIIAK
ncbi:MAG: hypothetical protein K1X36_09220 [Pyrinomonadaceae bacterium]|nr:hypothetical protein [Pyrinomonadaceae bacterium]